MARWSPAAPPPWSPMPLIPSLAPLRGWPSRSRISTEGVASMGVPARQARERLPSARWRSPSGVTEWPPCNWMWPASTPSIPSRREARRSPWAQTASRVSTLARTAQASSSSSWPWMCPAATPSSSPAIWITVSRARICWISSCHCRRGTVTGTSVPKWLAMWACRTMCPWPWMRARPCMKVRKWPAIFWPPPVRGRTMRWWDRWPSMAPNTPSPPAVTPPLRLPTVQGKSSVPWWSRLRVTTASLRNPASITATVPWCSR